MARQMKDSGVEWIGKVPADWGTGRLQWCIEEINESNDPIISTEVLSLTIEKGVIPYAEKGNQGNKSKENYSEYKIAFPNTLVVNSMNVIIGAVGISQYMGCVSPVYYVFRERKENDLQYIYYLFTNTGFQKEMRKYANGILEIRLRISSTDLMKLNIPIPPYIEQQRISKYLDKRCAYIDSILEKTRTSIEEYKKLKQAIITKAVTKGVRGERPMKESGIEWIGEIPEEWRITQLRHCASVKAGITLGKVYDKNIELHELPYLRVANVQDGYVDLGDLAYLPISSEEIEKYKLHAGDVLMTEGGDRDKLGRGCVWDGRIDPCLHQNHIFAVHAHETFLNPYFLEYLTASKAGRCYFDVTAIKTTNLACTSSSKVLSFLIPLPSLNEQEEIVTYLKDKCSAIDSLIVKKQKCLAELERYKKSMIYEYVTGKKEVPSNELEAIAVNPILLKALLYIKTYELLGKKCRGRVQIQKMLYLIESMNNLKLDSQYVRQKYGPMDADLDAVEAFMEEKCWLKTIQGSPTAYQKMDHYQEYHTEFSKYLASYEVEIERIVRFFENKNTSEAERFATLVAVWNDFILDGNANPSDEELIHEAITNWHPHKANYKYATWQDTVSKMRAHGIIPHGYGRHTILR